MAANATTTTTTRHAFAIDVTATTQIDGPAQAVWDVLADTERYSEWNPFITRFDGQLNAGQRIAVQLQLPDRPVQRMQPTLQDVTPGASFSWLGHVGIAGILDGRHHFEVLPTSDTTCTLVQSERLSGLLLPAFRAMLLDKTPKAFELMNEALRARVEHAN